MKFIVDKMPELCECLFYRKTAWVNDHTIMKNVCSLPRMHCNRTEFGCRLLKPISVQEAEEEE